MDMDTAQIQEFLGDIRNALPIEELDFTSERPYNCLKNNKTLYVGHIRLQTKSALLSIPDMGRKAVAEIYSNLDNLGLSRHVPIFKEYEYKRRRQSMTREEHTEERRTREEYWNERNAAEKMFAAHFEKHKDEAIELFRQRAFVPIPVVKFVPSEVEVGREYRHSAKLITAVAKRLPDAKFRDALEAFIKNYSDIDPA